MLSRVDGILSFLLQTAWASARLIFLYGVTASGNHNAWRRHSGGWPVTIHGYNTRCYQLALCGQRRQPGRDVTGMHAPVWSPTLTRTGRSSRPGRLSVAVAVNVWLGGAAQRSESRGGEPQHKGDENVGTTHSRQQPSCNIFPLLPVVPAVDAYVPLLWSSYHHSGPRGDQPNRT